MKYFLFLFFTFSQLSIAQTCEEETSLKWILQEAQNHDPRILLERLNVEKILASKKDAQKFINPELEHFSVWGKEFEPGQVYMNESRLWFTLQLSNKRNKKLSEWSKDKTLALHEQEMLKQSLLKDLWLNFFRIHQINDEITLKKSLITKLDKILAQYRKRKFLSPDQSLEERIFTMVVDNFTLSLNQIERERLSILFFFKEITAFQCEIKKIVSEGEKIRWPNIDHLEKLSEQSSLRLKQAELTFELAKAQATVADAKTISDLRLSPVVQNYKSTEKNNYMYGVAFTFPLPLFDRNQSDRERTFLSQKYAEKNVDLTRLREQNQFDFKLMKYKTGLSLLNEVEVIDQSLTKFKNVNESFAEGKLSISNIVEFCRQLDEMMHKYHVGESILMNDLMEIYEQRGNVDAAVFEQLI